MAVSLVYGETMRSRLSPYYHKLRRLPTAMREKPSEQLHQELSIDSRWSLNYVVLIISSCAIATFGLIGNSAAVIIGAMIIAPLMLPLRGLAFAALEGDLELLRRALISIIGGTILAITLSMTLGLITPIPSFGSEFQARAQPSLVDLGIAIAAGGISGFAKIRTGISDVLAGTAIAVALMPPICVVGLAMSRAFTTPSFWVFSQQAFLLYLTNLIGIVLACMVVFMLAGYTEMSHSLLWAVVSVVILAIPLGTNFASQVRRARVEDYIRALLVRNTITIGQRDVTLLDTRIDWSARPPVVYLNIQVASDLVEEITPKQVQEMQKFISQQVGRSLKLVLFVSRGRTVTEAGVNGVLPNVAPSSIDRDKPLLSDPILRRDTRPFFNELEQEDEANLLPEKAPDEAAPTAAPTAPEEGAEPEPNGLE